MKLPPPTYKPTCPGKQTMSPNCKSDLLLITFPSLLCELEVLLIEYPKCLYTYCVNPEQSNVFGPVAPYLYLHPKYFFA